MNSNEHALIEELKSSSKGKIQQSMIDAYLKKPDAESIITQALALLERATIKDENT
jgi:hypothetical protein